MILHKPKVEDRIVKILINVGMPVILLAGLILYIYFNGLAPVIYEKMDWWFTVWIATGLSVVEQGKELSVAIFCFLFQIVVWVVTYILIKITVIDTMFPRFRIITPMKDVFSVCRKIKFTTGGKDNYKYCYVKFHLFPLIQWHRIGVPKPELFHKKQVECGNKGVRWRRFPASIDVFCPTTNVIFDKNDNCYYMGVEANLYREDDSKEYDDLSFEGIKKIGAQVIESVKGDWGLIKDQFHMGIVVREKDLPKSDLKQRVIESIYNCDETVIDNKKDDLDKPVDTLKEPVLLEEQKIVEVKEEPVQKKPIKIDVSDIQPPQRKTVRIKIIKHRTGDDEDGRSDANFD